ncbi:MAG: hydroxylamine reductase [Planctomycetota bacterium]|jgi:hydroxylamine reductase
MLCYQCEQTVGGKGCTKQGVCGKVPEVAALQDVLLHAVKGLSQYASRARELGVTDEGVNACSIKALFATVTNVNFDPESLEAMIRCVSGFKERAATLYAEAAAKAGKTVEKLTGPAEFEPADDLAGLAAQGEKLGLKARTAERGEETVALEELVTYGIKGLAAYAVHAMILEQTDDAVFGFVHGALARIAEGASAEELVGLAFKAGETNIRAMELLDAGNTETYGHPEPTEVRVSPVKGKAILVSGHDLKDLEELLKQTEGKGINVYTHGEMLPANAYPGLKKYAHLAGNYGSAWQNQREEFDAFPGAILMTTNCIQKPKDGYIGRIFTCGMVDWPGVVHVRNHEFGPVIDAALAAPGFAEDAPEKKIVVGFGRNAVLGVADKVIEAVKGGAIRHFFLVGGCDGAKPGRNYYTEFAQKVPDDCVILTLACGKYRFNKLDFGQIGGIPRLLDIGQCNDAYSAVKIALALADAFGTDVNGLPLSLVLSWYEQKAVAILLSLLHLGVKNIKIGPSLPAFVSPGVLNTLVEKFGIAPITTPEEDLKAILG